jgi:hypothetical protein
MKLSFEETMSGTLRDTNGAEHPISFTVQSEGEGRGFYTLTGTMKAPPWAESARCTGSFHLSPFAIRYHLKFGRFTLEAKKTPSLLKPVHSMTVMPATLRNEAGAVVGEGEMRFDLRDLQSFLLSWLTPQHRALPVGE